MNIALSPIISLAGLALTFLWACGSPSAGDATSKTGSSDTVDTAVYSMTEYYQSSPYFQQKGDQYDTTYFRATYPQSKDTAFNALIMSSLGAKNRADLEQMGESFLADYDSYVEEAQQPELVHAWFLDIASRVRLYTPHLLVVSKTITEYAGGAHGNFAELFHNYEVKTGKTIALVDVVPAERQQELITLGEKIFRKQEGLAEGEALDNRYFFDEGIFSLADNFAFDRNGLVFQYNPYEIKAWSEGVTRLEIPYEQLQDLLTDSGRKIVAEIQNTNR